VLTSLAWFAVHLKGEANHISRWDDFTIALAATIHRSKIKNSLVKSTATLSATTVLIAQEPAGSELVSPGGNLRARSCRHSPAIR
jgi:hypothetical protein